MQRRSFLSAAAVLPIAAAGPARGHHGWSSFDLSRPLYLEGAVVRVAWRNPHAEVELERAADLRLPADLGARPLPAQAAAVDGALLLQSAQLPRRPDARWRIELAPLTRLEAWKVPTVQPGDRLAVLGYTFAGEQGDAVLRAEYLFLAGRTYGMRSAPA